MQAAPLSILTFAALLAAPDLTLAQPPAPIVWGCDAPAGRTCYFSIQFAGGGSRTFSLPSGRKMAVAGVRPGADAYLVSIDAPNFGDANRCKQLLAVGRSCQRKVVDAAYND